MNILRLVLPFLFVFLSFGQARETSSWLPQVRDATSLAKEKGLDVLMIVLPKGEKSDFETKVLENKMFQEYASRAYVVAVVRANKDDEVGKKLSYEYGPLGFPMVICIDNQGRTYGGGSLNLSMVDPNHGLIKSTIMGIHCFRMSKLKRDFNLKCADLSAEIGDDWAMVNYLLEATKTVNKYGPLIGYEKVLEDILRLDPFDRLEVRSVVDMYSALYRVSKAMLDEDFDKAIENGEGFVKTDHGLTGSDVQPIFYLLATAYLEKQDFNNAILTLTKALRADPNGTFSEDMMGMLLKIEDEDEDE